MPIEYTVQPGDCIGSIAFRHGFFWETVWNHGDNATLKQNRGESHILLPGDVVVIPDKRENPHSGATDKRHRFKRKGVPAKLHLQLFDEDRPRANLPYRMELENIELTGTTDGEGNIDVIIPPDAFSATLFVGDDPDPYLLELGHMDPVEEVSGVQARLANLGFECDVTGELDEQTIAALKDFQHKYNLTESGQIDGVTRDKLGDVHRC